MAASIALTTPLRFYQIGSQPDYLTVWPTPDNILQRQQWHEGIEAVPYWYKDHVVNQLLSVQFEVIGITDETIKVYKWNQTTNVFDLNTTLIHTDITPTGWTGNDVNRYDFTPSQAGLYYLEFTEPGWRSDEFVVQNTDKYKKRLVEIEYYNTENDFDTIFFDGAVQKYTGKTFFEGNIIYNSPKNEYSQFETDPGSVKRLKATPQRTATLQLANVHYTYNDIVNYIFGLDRVFVNGIQYTSDESPEYESIDDTDLNNISINLTRAVANNLII